MKENRSKISGILSIISGSFGIFGFLFSLLIIFAVMIAPNAIISANSTLTLEILNLALIIYGFVAVFSLLLGILAIVGGVFAIRKKFWGLALAGAIASIFIFLPTGVASIIYISTGRVEFLPLKQPKAGLQS